LLPDGQAASGEGKEASEMNMIRAAPIAAALLALCQGASAEDAKMSPH
jgi:hypothetical protein